MNQRHASYWEATLPPAASAQVTLPTHVDVLIVGAGFMGRWLAYWLGKLRPAAKVLVLERDGFSYGASSRNAGFLTTGQVSEMLQDCRSLGLQAVAEVFLRRQQGLAMVRQEFPALAIDPCGSTDFDPINDEKREFVAQLHATLGQTVFALREANLGGVRRPAFFQPQDAGVQPVELLQRLGKACPDTPFAFDVQVRQIAQGLATVQVQGTSQEVRYGRAFVCTNAFATELDPGSRVVPGRGQVIVTSPVKTATDRTLGYLNHGYDYFRFVDQRLLLGGGRNRFRAQEQTSRLEVTTEVLDHLRATAAVILGHADFAIDYHWAGIMGFIDGAHLGGSPRRRIDETAEAVAGFGGMGVALAPVVAREIAAQL